MINNETDFYFNLFIKDISKDNKSLRKQLKFLGVRYRQIIPNMSRNVHFIDSRYTEFKGVMTITAFIGYTSDNAEKVCYTLRKDIKTIKFIRHIKISNINL